MQQRRVALVAAVVVLASVVGAACADLTASGSNDTLAPLVPDRTGPPITQVAAVGPDGNPVVNTQGSTTTLPREQIPAQVAADDTDAVSVATRFLAAAASGDQDVATALEMPGREPAVFDWASAAFAEYTQVAGAQAWGEPTCSDPAGPTITCSWLQTETPPTLTLIQQDGNWLVSHPMFNVAAAPQAAGSGCIVGSANVNVRGGPGTNWPRFDQIAPGTCSVPIFDAVHTEAGSGDRWRMIEANGVRGWIIERVIDM